jgi:hypothetical protein
LVKYYKWMQWKERWVTTLPVSGFWIVYSTTSIWVNTSANYCNLSKMYCFEFESATSTLSKLMKLSKLLRLQTQVATVGVSGDRWVSEWESCGKWELRKCFGQDFFSLEMLGRIFFSFMAAFSYRFIVWKKRAGMSNGRFRIIHGRIQDSPQKNWRQIIIKKNISSLVYIVIFLLPPLPRSANVIIDCRHQKKLDLYLLCICYYLAPLDILLLDFLPQSNKS